jgi:hypothetical protein
VNDMRPRPTEPAWHVLAWSGVAALLCLQACTPGHPGRTVIDVRPDRSDAQISITVNGGLAVIEIASPSGIGGADFEIAAGPIPERIILRFLLTGLEHMDFSYGDTTVTVSISSGPGREVRETVRFSTSEGEQEVSADSPYWMTVSIVPAESPPPTAPLQSAAIDVGAPEDYLKSGLRSFSIEWIDYYR